MGLKPRKRRIITVDALARVEGEGAMYLELTGDRVDRVELRIYEPPRFFEALLRGRRMGEAVDITARICGICPIAYQMSACAAIEQACGVTVDGPLADLRRLIYCGEWIESHCLHLYMLHAPDFLGYAGGIEMAADHPELVRRGLGMKKTGNALVALLGGREIHPINLRVGGFYRVPTRRELRGLYDELARGRDAALETVRWVAGFELPEVERDWELVALVHPDRYPIETGVIGSTTGLRTEARGFPEHFVEEQVPHSTALHSTHVGHGPYLTGPLARYALNRDRLSPVARQAADDAGLGADCRNPFASIVVRAVEILYAFDEALRLIDDYRPPDRPAVEVEPRAATGHGATEAPRGLLYHRYQIDAAGLIEHATIVPPTSQNQASIEADLRHLAAGWTELADDELTLRCEQAIRNHDPCISCSTHFLDLTVRRNP
jgi:sulfhydrogenase subunit alpha